MDIDKVTLLAHAFDRNGQYVGWSPFFDYSSLRTIKKSEELPAPTGEKLQTRTDVNGKEFNYFEPTTEEEAKRADRTWDLLKQAVTLITDKDTAEALGSDLIFTTDFRHENWEASVDNLIELLELTKDGKLFLKKDIYDDNKRAIDYAIDRINEHNTYFIDNPQREEDANKNITAAKLKQIITDPVNIIQAQTPLDAVTKEPKALAANSPRGKIEKRLAPGNSAANAQMLVNNRVGSETIGISASSGMKCFFNLTQYYNRLLATGTIDKIQKLYFNKNIGGKDYHLLVNAWCKDPERLREIGGDDLFNIYDTLLRVSANQDDAALKLSAILSLGVDNAKDLALSSLNAGTETIGLYLYGFMLGMNWTDISNIMISDVANVINEYMHSNVINNQRGAYSMDYVFKTLENKKSVPMPAYDLIEFKNENGEKEFAYYFQEIMFGGFRFGLKYYDFRDKLFKLINEKIENGESADLIARINKVKLELAKNSAKIFSDYVDSYDIAVGKYMDRLDTYVRAKIRIGETPESRQKYNDIKRLYYGNTELKRQNTILGLNQGIKALSSEKLKFLSSFENMLNDRIKELEFDPDAGNISKSDLAEFRAYLRNYEAENHQPYKGDYSISLESFCSDATYRQTVIDFYQKIKHTFNILDAVWEAPHFRQYLRLFAIDLKADQISARFRVLNKMLADVNVAYSVSGAKEVKNYTRAIENFINTIITNSWLKTQPLIVTDNMVANLGTRKGNITFMRWMNNIVLPNLKVGNLGNNNTVAWSNRFLEVFAPRTNDWNMSKYPVQIYTIPYNPMDPNHRDVMTGLKIDFNKLRSYYYYVKTGNGQVKQYPIMDLLFYYNMIANKNVSNTTAITPFFEDLNRTGEYDLIRDYNRFVSEFDSNSDIVEGVDYMKDDLLRAVAPIMSYKQAVRKNVPYFYQLDKETKRYKLQKKNQTESRQRSYMGDDGEFENDADFLGLNDNEFGGMSTKKKEYKYFGVDSSSLDHSKYNPDMPFNTSTDKVITVEEFKSGNTVRYGTMEIKSEDGTKLKEIKYEGKTYKPTVDENGKQTASAASNLIKALKEAKENYQGKTVDIKESDLEIPKKKIYVGNELVEVADMEGFQRTLDYLFTIC